MTENSAKRVGEIVDTVYCSESRRILATLIRLLPESEIAEDALHDAFTVALERWPKDGVPGNPRAWLVSGPPNPDGHSPFTGKVASRGEITSRASPTRQPYRPVQNVR